MCHVGPLSASTCPCVCFIVVIIPDLSMSWSCRWVLGHAVMCTLVVLRLVACTSVRGSGACLMMLTDADCSTWPVMLTRLACTLTQLRSTCGRSSTPCHKEPGRSAGTPATHVNRSSDGMVCPSAARAARTANHAMHPNECGCFHVVPYSCLHQAPVSQLSHTPSQPSAGPVQHARELAHAHKVLKLAAADMRGAKTSQVLATVPSV